MSKPDREDDADQTWDALIAAVRKAPGDELRPLDADRVVQAALQARRAQLAAPLRSEERIVSYAALFAAAASLLLTLFCWSDVKAAWSPEPAILDLPVALEPVE